MCEKFISLYVWLFICEISHQNGFHAYQLDSNVSQSGYEIVHAPAKLSFDDAPHWDVETQSWYFVDLFSEGISIFRYDYHEKKIYSATIENEIMPSFLIPLACCKNQFGVELERSLKVIEWNGKSNSAKVLRTVFSVEPEQKYSTNHMDIVKADPTGRFYGGTLRTELCSFSSAANASFYRYTRLDGVKRILEDKKVCGGLAWNTNTNKFYFSDTCQLKIRQFNWNPLTGDLTNEKVAYDFGIGDDLSSYAADGITIDTNGNLYAAIYNGTAVWKIDPRNSKILDQIEMPTQLMTSPALGGPNLDELFVTSASLPLGIYTGNVIEQQLTDSAGSLFIIKGLNAKGLPGTKLQV